MRFPNLGSDDVIIPETTNLSFNIELSSTADPKRVLVSNICKAIVEKLAVKLEGNEILGMNLWKTESEKWNAVRQGIILGSGCTLECMKL